MIFFLILFLVSGGIMIAMSVPLIQRKVAPNSLYGFRVRRTLENPAVWYAANAYSAWRMLWLGIGVMIVAVVAYFVPGLDVTAYASVVGIFTVAGLIATLIQCFRYLRTLADDPR